MTEEMLLTTELKYPESQYSQKDYASFYGKYLLEFEERKFPWYKSFCPFHQDKTTPNFTVNVVNGKCRCFACGWVGDHTDFLKALFPSNWMDHDLPSDVTDHAVLDEIATYRKDRVENIELERALDCRLSETAHELLMKQPMALKALEEQRGFNVNTLVKYKIGWIKGSMTIPVYNLQNEFVTLKVHKKYQTDGAENQLYPWSALSQNFNYAALHEGEPDTLLARQMGFNAVTQILGCNSWSPEFNKFFNNKVVYLAYDNDIPGQIATKMVAKELLTNSTATVYHVIWPTFMVFNETHGEDSTDFFIKYKKTAKDYTDLLGKAKLISLKEVLDFQKILEDNKPLALQTIRNFYEHR